MRTIEQKEKEHYDFFYETKKERDVYFPSMTCRRFQVRQAFKLLDIEKKDLTILDVGCGIGAKSIYLNGFYKKYVGIDLSEGMIKVAREFCKNIKNAHFMVSNVKEMKSLNIPPPDVVLIDGALHHMTELNIVFDQIRSIVKPGTLLIAIEPQSANKAIQLLRYLRMKIDKSYSKNQIFFSEMQLRDILMENKLREAKFFYTGFITPVFAQVPLRPEIIFRPTASLAIKLEKILYKILKGPFKKLSWNIVAIARF